MTNDKHRMADEQLGKELESLISGNVESVSPPAGTFLAIQDRLGSQAADWSPSRLIKKLVPGEWRLPMFTGMIFKISAAVIVAVAVVAVVVFQGSDSEGTQQAAEPTATAVTVPEATPIAKLIVPDDLVPFDDMGGVAGSPWWHAGEMRTPPNTPRGAAGGHRLGPNASDEAVASFLALDVKQKGFGLRRWQLLSYAPGIDPMADGPVYVYDPDSPPGGVGHNKGDFTLSATDTRVINVEEFAFCDDGRGVYLQHSEKPAEVGETFVWDVYALPSEANDGTFHLVMTAEPNSPITCDGPDPKKIDIKITAVDGVMISEIAEADIKMVGMLSNDAAIQEMCAN
ncbi:MAG: hypothetical protein HOE43_11425 [Chloroflexi bacterium]|jgi:hypothetical protein|nr:hypothetical protein [Chloroflexota bacterium]